MPIERIVWMTVVIVLVLVVCRLAVVVRNLARSVMQIADAALETTNAIEPLLAHPDRRREIERQRLV